MFSLQIYVLNFLSQNIFDIIFYQNVENNTLYVYFCTVILESELIGRSSLVHCEDRFSFLWRNIVE